MIHPAWVTISMASWQGATSSLVCIAVGGHKQKASHKLFSSAQQSRKNPEGSFNRPLKKTVMSQVWNSYRNNSGRLKNKSVRPNMRRCASWKQTGTNMERRDYNAILRIMNQIKKYNVSLVISLWCIYFQCIKRDAALLLDCIPWPALSSCQQTVPPAPAALPTKHPTNPRPNSKMLKQKQIDNCFTFSPASHNLWKLHLWNVNLKCEDWTSCH